MNEEVKQSQRVIRGLAQALAQKAYADVTIADIVANAGTSRRTFYEHFDSKPQCFLALYEMVSLEGLQVLVSHIDPKNPWQQQVEDALTAYFTWMSQNPLLLRTLFMDILALGGEGLKMRRKVHDQMAQFIQQTLDARQCFAVQAHATAVVGGIHELVMQQLEAGKLSDPTALGRVAASFVRSSLAGQPGA